MVSGAGPYYPFAYPPIAYCRRRGGSGGEGVPVKASTNNEQLARDHAEDLTSHIEIRGGQYLKDESGGLHLILEGRRISLDPRPDNYALIDLVLKACNVSTLSYAAKAALQRIQVEAYRQAGRMRLRKFSAMSDDGERLYIPIEGGSLLLIEADDMEVVSNGSNQEGICGSSIPIRIRYATPTMWMCTLAWRISSGSWSIQIGRAS